MISFSRHVSGHESPERPVEGSSEVAAKPACSERHAFVMRLSPGGHAQVADHGPEENNNSEVCVCENVTPYTLCPPSGFLHFKESQGNVNHIISLLRLLFRPGVRRCFL